MKKFLVFLLIPILFGCEIYEQPTNPQLSGRWVVDGVTFPNVNGGQSYILSDTVVVSGRNLVGVDENGVGTFINNWSDPTIPWHDKFIIGETVWEFETNLVGLPDRDNNNSPTYGAWDYYFVYGDLYSQKYWNKLKIESTMTRTYTIVQYGLNTIKLTLPKVWTMYNYNGEIYFLEEVISLTLVRI